MTCRLAHMHCSRMLQEGPPGGTKGGPGAFPFIVGGPAGCGEGSRPSCSKGPGLGPGGPVGSNPARLHTSHSLSRLLSGFICAFWSSRSLLVALQDGARVQGPRAQMVLGLALLSQILPSCNHNYISEQPLLHLERTCVLLTASRAAW